MVDAPSSMDSQDGDKLSDSGEPPGFGGQSLLHRLGTLCEQARRHHAQGRAQDTTEATRYGNLTGAFDIAPPDSRSPISWDAYAMLPSRDGTSHAIDIVLHIACCKMQFLGCKTLHVVADEAYRAVESGSIERCRKQLSLLPVVLALARRFDSEWPLPIDEHDASTANGARYFRASRALLDPSDSQDLMSLRTLLCMIIYTQSCSMLSACYSYICMTVAAALRMGLLDKTMHGMNAEERADARTIVTVLFISDAYVTTSLGLPRTLRDIEWDRFAQLVDGQPFVGATDAHARLIRILAELVEANHPPCKHIPQSNGFYGVRYSNIVEAERKLAAWFNSLESSLAFKYQSEEGTLRFQLMLRLYHAHVQLALYRPFLHHALRIPHNADDLKRKAYNCGSACIKAGMQVARLVEKMEASGVLNTAHCFLSLTIAHTVACLVLFVIGASESPTTHETKDAVRRLKSICARYAERDNSIRRCLMFLETYFPKMPPENFASSPEFQNRFEPNLSLFSSAFDELDDATLQSLGMVDTNDEHLQALAMPSFQTFMNSSF